MRASLKPYPGSACDAVTAIEADLLREGARLKLRYDVTGAVDQLRLPEPAAPERLDNLWQHTCFEAFIAGAESTAYYELNFSSSTEWACYRFTGYREGMATAREIGPPQITVRQDGSRFELTVSLLLASLPAGAWRVGLSAVIEEVNARKSYWALAHPSAKPDFHHSDSFALELGA